MAARTSKNANGETRFGAPTRTVQGGIYIRSGKPLQAAWIAWDAVDTNGARTTVYMWPSSDGKVRSGTSLPANTETGGTVVGTQT
jgi:hypothetical protein